MTMRITRGTRNIIDSQRTLPYHSEGANESSWTITKLVPKHCVSLSHFFKTQPAQGLQKQKVKREHFYKFPSIDK